MSHYILKGTEPIKVTLDEWAEKFGRDNRVVDKTDTTSGYRISTVFLGIDHSFGDSDTPILFETMAFPDSSFSEDDMERYSTWDEAKEGHQRMVVKYGGPVAEPITLDEDLFTL